jgi:hypothetical protein
LTGFTIYEKIPVSNKRKGKNKMLVVLTPKVLEALKYVNRGTAFQTLSNKGERDKRLTVMDAASIIAEHVHAFGGEVEDFRESIMKTAIGQLDELRVTAAEDKYWDEKAEREGKRY